jgi:chromate reductase
MEKYRIGVIVGSLSSTSINRRLAHALMKLAPESLEMSEIGFGDLPLYSQDFDADFPAPARAWKQALAEVDAVLFVTPEYNRSIPGGLKNAIDWATRPYGKNSFNRKPSAVIGTSPGKIGTAVAQQHLRSLLSFCNSPQMNAPEAFIQYQKDMFDQDDTVADEGTASFLHKFMAEYAGFIERCFVVLPRRDGVDPCLAVRAGADGNAGAAAQK